ncbi:hypothetical protein DSECCO2_560810 [anaerobic digester metagenome]
MENLNIDIKDVTALVEDYIHLSRDDQKAIRSQVFYKRCFGDIEKNKPKEEAQKEINKKIGLMSKIVELNDDQLKELIERAKIEGLDLTNSQDQELETIEINIKFKNIK